MAIHFTSQDRAARIVKALKGELAKAGHDIKLTTVREAAAKAFGYRGWNDLLKRSVAGDNAPSNPTQVVLQEAAISSTLARELEIDTPVAVTALTKVFTLIRPSEAWSWPTAAASIAGGIERRAESITAIERKGLPGFEVLFKDNTHDLLMRVCVSEDGTRVIATTSKRKHPGGDEIDEAEYEGNFGAYLHRFGLMSNRSTPPSDGLVLSVLRNLDARAMGMLRFVDRFGTDAYRLACSLPHDSPFAKMLVRFPSLAGTIPWLSALREYRRYGPDKEIGSTQAMLEEIISSDDPLRTIVDHAAEAGTPEYPVDRSAVLAVIETMGRGSRPRDEQFLSPWNLATLSFCPIRWLPSDRIETHVIEEFLGTASTCLHDGMDPELFYGEIAERFDGDWLKFTYEANRACLSLMQIPLSTGKILAGKLAQEMGFEYMPGFTPDSIADPIGEGLMRFVVEGLGVVGASERADAWYDCKKPSMGSVSYEKEVRMNFKALRESGALGSLSSYKTALEMVDAIDAGIRKDIERMLDGPHAF